jgi:hypothetical protein
VIPYELKGQTGEIEGRLRDDDTIAFRVLSGPGKFPPEYYESMEKIADKIERGLPVDVAAELPEDLSAREAWGVPRITQKELQDLSREKMKQKRAAATQRTEVTTEAPK